MPQAHIDDIIAPPPSINPSTLNTQPISDAASGLVDKIKSAASDYGNKIQSVMGAPDATQGWADIQSKMHEPVDPMGILTQGSPVGAAEAMAPLVGKVLQGAEEAPEAVTRMIGGKSQVLKTVPLDDISGDPGNKIYPQVVAKYQKQGYTEPPELRLSDTSNPDTPTKYTIQEGHHRILADAKNGADSVQAWVPQENSNLESAVKPTSVDDAANKLMEAYNNHSAGKSGNTATFYELRNDPSLKNIDEDTLAKAAKKLQDDKKMLLVRAASSHPSNTVGAVKIPELDNGHTPYFTSMMSR
jgi:cell pole-organizing protein PopZ